MTEKRILITILLVTFLVIILMFPLRNEVYEDDFVFAYSIEQFLNNHKLVISQFSVPLLFPTFWGIIFSIIFGYSFKSLHLAIIFFLPFLAIIVFKFLKEAGNIPIKNSFILTLFFISIPWIFQYSMMFMSEIPFLTLELFSLFFYFKGIRERDNKKLFLGSIFASLAFFTRQLGIVIPISCAIALITSGKNNSLDSRLKNITSAVALPILSFIAFSWWSTIPQNQTIELYNYQNDIKEKFNTLLSYPNSANIHEKIELLKLFFHRSIRLFNQIFGIFSPILILNTASNFNRIRKTILKNRLPLLISLAIFGTIGLDYLINGQYNLAYPHTLYRYELLFPIPWDHIWKFLVGLGIILFPQIISLNFKKVKKVQSENLFLIFSFLGIGILSITSMWYWNKYIIPLLPFILIFIATKTRDLKLFNKFTLVIVLLLLIDSFQMTKVRYDQNGISQQKGFELIQSGILPDEILPNTNYLWTFWFTYEEKIGQELEKVNFNKRSAKLPKIDEGKKYQYIINSQIDMQRPLPDANYEIIETIDLRSLLVKSKVYVLKRTD